MMPGLAGGPVLTVSGVMLLGITVDVHVLFDIAEHRRREAADIGAVVDPRLLDRLLDLPHGIPVGDPAAWAELSGQHPGVVHVSDDGPEVTRLLRPPLRIMSVTVNAVPRRELKAIQAATWFGGFYPRRVRISRQRLPKLALVEADYFGVEVVDQQDHVLVPPAAPPKEIMDKWSWLNEEQAYHRWLTADPA